MNKMKKDLICPLCNIKVYSEIGKGCKMCGMVIHNNEEFCSKMCKVNYKKINKEWR